MSVSKYLYMIRLNASKKALFDFLNYINKHIFILLLKILNNLTDKIVINFLFSKSVKNIEFYY